MNLQKKNSGDPLEDSEIDIHDILEKYIEQPRLVFGGQYQQTADTQRLVLIIIFLGCGLFGNIGSWFIIIRFGWLVDELVILSTTVLVMGLYFLFFPGLFKAHYNGKLNGILFIVLSLSFLIAFAFSFVLKHILYA